MNKQDLISFKELSNQYDAARKEFYADLCKLGWEQFEIMRDAYRLVFSPPVDANRCVPRWVEYGSPGHADGYQYTVIERGYRGNPDEEVHWFEIDERMFSEEGKAAIKAEHVAKFEADRMEEQKEHKKAKQQARKDLKEQIEHLQTKLTNMGESQ